MAGARDLRRCALQVLYQFDADHDASLELVRQSLEDSAGGERAHQGGFDLAVAAWAVREQADAAVAVLTPDWPTYRQPVIDRSILRLAYFEMTTGRTPPKVVINEAVELAREFSTEKSPLFINGVLDKLYRSLPQDGEEPAPDESPAPEPPVPHNDAPTCGA